MICRISNSIFRFLLTTFLFMKIFQITLFPIIRPFSTIFEINSWNFVSKPSYLRKIGVMKNSEEFDAETIKTKLIFVSAQLMYTIVTLLPVKLLYNSYIFSILYMTGIFAWCVFQGAEGYFEDFTERFRVNTVSGKKTS